MALCAEHLNFALQGISNKTTQQRRRKRKEEKEEKKERKIEGEAWGKASSLFFFYFILPFFFFSSLPFSTLINRQTGCQLLLRLVLIVLFCGVYTPRRVVYVKNGGRIFSRVASLPGRRTSRSAEEKDPCTFGTYICICTDTKPTLVRLSPVLRTRTHKNLDENIHTDR